VALAARQKTKETPYDSASFDTLRHINIPSTLCVYMERKVNIALPNVKRNGYFYIVEYL
jgi:hypothetical protein